MADPSAAPLPHDSQPAGGAMLTDGPTGPSRRRPQVVIVTGPTAVGKTAVSLLLAQRLSCSTGPEGEGGGGGGGGVGCGEVISADSVQVYRGLDVGSDKLPVAERLGVPHHMIDVRDPCEDFSAGEFFECARPVAEDIVRRGGIPLVVGGTGLYLRWFVVGKGGALRATPEALAAVAAAMQTAWTAAAEAKRKELAAAAAEAATGGEAVKGEAAAASGDAAGEAGAAAGVEAGLVAGAGAGGAAVATTTAEALAAAAAGALTEEEKWDAAAALLQKWGDEVAYTRISAERNNYYRLERALSILSMHPGSKLADFEPKADAPASELDYDFRCFFLHRPRLQLYDRIAGRVEEMVCGGGLLEEAALLLRLGLAPGQNMAAKAIGYRQAMDWLLAAKASGRPVGLPELCGLHASICQATHKLVRAQMTWFRDDPMYKWIDVDGRPAAEVVDEIARELAKPQHEGGCGDSGRLSKEEQKAIMRYRPQLKLLTEAAAAGAAAAAAKGTTATAAAAASAGAGAGATGCGGGGSGGGKAFPPKPKSKTALAAEAAAAAAAAAEAALQPLLDRVNGVLLPGIPDAATAAAGSGKGSGGGGAAAAGADEEDGGGEAREAKRLRATEL